VPRDVIGRHLIEKVPEYFLVSILSLLTSMYSAKFGGEDSVNMACVVQEHHTVVNADAPEQTELHLHAAIELLVECDLPNCERLFDIEHEGTTYHPNFQTIRNWTGAIKYIDKEDTQPWEYNVRMQWHRRQQIAFYQWWHDRFTGVLVGYVASRTPNE
jgi:hypothetical protein